jgi:ABC-type siderophore export system fused ATPase/permease subunit
MILTSASSSSLSWLAVEFITTFVAVIGGVLVFRGLWIENQADDALKKEHPESFVDGVKSLKLKSKRGWRKC